MSSFEIQTMFGRGAATAARGAWTGSGARPVEPAEIVRAAKRAGRYASLVMRMARFYARGRRPETLVTVSAAGVYFGAVLIGIVPEMGMKEGL